MFRTFSLIAALAAPFGELPFQPVGGGAACLRPTGAPGELVRWYDGGAEVLAVRPTGLVATARVPLGRRSGCPAVASAANGAAILAVSSAGRVRVALREPGGGWGATVTLPSNGAGEVDVAMSARGDAIVAWTEGVDARGAGRVRVARRAPGAAFGAAETLRPCGTVATIPSIQAGMDATGEAVVLFTGEATRARETVNVAIGRPGAQFGTAQALGAGSIEAPALAVAADGRALVTASGYDGLELYERPPGGDFGARTILFRGTAAGTAIALRPGGAAVIAWQNTPGEDVIAVVRDGATPFGAPIDVQPPPPGNRGSGSATVTLRDGGPPADPSGQLRAALGADGRALLVWATEDRALGTATVTASGRTERGTLGSPLREPFGPSPLLLADGSRALAWTDDRSYLSYLSSGPLAGRLHLALEGAPAAPAAEPPTVTAGRPRRSALRPAQPLVLPIRCSAACDLRAALPGRQRDFMTASLARAGTVDLRFEPLFEAIAPAHPGPIRIDLRSGAAGASRVQRQTISVRLRRLPAPPLPRIERLRVRRRGDDLVVHWRTDVQPRETYFLVYGTSVRDVKKDRSPSFEYATGRGVSFRVVLRGAARKRFVRVAAVQLVGGRVRSTVVRGPFTGS